MSLISSSSNNTISTVVLSSCEFVFILARRSTFARRSASRISLGYANGFFLFGRPKLNLASVEGFGGTCLVLELNELELKLELELWRSLELDLSVVVSDVAGLLILATIGSLTAFGLLAAAKYEIGIVVCFWGF